MRHIEVNQVWLQDKVYIGEITLNKVGTNENIADALTKALNAETLGHHVENSSAECRRDRHWMAPAVVGDSSEQEQRLESKVAAEGTIAEEVEDYVEGSNCSGD